MNYAIESAFVDELDKIAAFSAALDKHPVLKGKQSQLPDKVQAEIIKKKMNMKKQAATATKTDPAKWEAAKAEAKAKMGGKHSARAMQLATQIYKKKGGGYSGDKPTAKNNSLKKWGKQKWQWSGGEKKKTAAVEQGGRGVYLPENKIKRLKQTEKGKEKLRAAERKKAKATREGKQYSSHGLAAGTSLSKSAAEKVAHRCRKDILKAFEVEGGALSMKALMKRTAKHPEFQVKKELAKLKKEGIVKDHPHGDMYTDMAEKTASVEYRGTTFPGYNKPIRSNRKNKKFMVLVKRGDRIKLVHFGQKGYEDFTQHKDKKRQKNYLTRSAGIRNKSGKLTKDDPFSPNYWARRKLW
ncbi:MAG: hypothetical protein VXZ72_00640 [Chlamydiota bacterium]|nr:hypothetical protein [Chlamydiota bacterium]